MGVRACTASQVKTWWTVEDFNYTDNALNNCYECNTRGHVKRDCPSQGHPRLTYSEKELDYIVNLLGHSWKCNQPGHVRIKCPKLGKSRDCLLPKRTRKEQGSREVEDEFKRIFWMEKKEEQSVSSSNVVKL